MRLILVFSIFLLISCTKKITSVIVEDYEGLEAYAEKIESPNIVGERCAEIEEYIPYEEDPTFSEIRFIRVNFHIMNDETRTRNFKEGEAEDYFKGMLKNANKRLAQNHPMNLPEGNSTPALHPKYQYVLTPNTNDPRDDGFYFHYDNELFYFINKGKNRNNYNKDVIKKYAVNDDHILNVFVMPHHPDSIASKTYKVHGTGIALGSSIKIAGIFEDGGPYWNFATLFNHEVGHVMGLAHAWTRSDGCDDTPSHPNCFSSTGKAPCDGLTSNNMMDYNNSQMAISPCQLGKIHKNIARPNSLQRKLVIPTWCDYNPENPIRIEKDTEWRGQKDLNGDLIINPGSTLKLYCRLSMAKESRIIIRPGATLVLDNAHLHNSCGDVWNGIEVQSQGDKSGRLIYLGSVLIENTASLNNQ